MPDDITPLLDALATSVDTTHREAVWQRVLTERAQSEMGGDGSEPSTGQTGEIELLTVPPRDIHFGSRRSSKFIGLLAAVVVLIAGIAALTHRGSSDIKINTSPTTEPAATSFAPTVSPTTTQQATSATESSVPIATTSVPSTQPQITFDALTLGPSHGTVLATFDGAAIGEFESGLGRTPEGGIYYAGYTSEARDHYFVQFFAYGALPAARYELPAEYLPTSSSGNDPYGVWMIGPDRVLYTLQYDQLGLAPVGLVAVPTTGPRAGTVVARADAGGHFGCWPSPAGIQCDVIGIVQPWVDPSGAMTGRTFPDANWLNADRAAAPEMPLLASGTFTESSLVPLKLNDGRTIGVTNLLPWAKLDAAVIGFNELSPRPGHVCVLGTVSGEGTSRFLELCVDDVGKLTSTTLGHAAHLLQGSSQQMITDRAMYTVESSGDRFNLIRYDF